MVSISPVRLYIDCGLQNVNIYIGSSKCISYNWTIAVVIDTVNSQIPRRKLATVITNMKMSQDKVQMAMARKVMNPYDLCSAAGSAIRHTVVL